MTIEGPRIGLALSGGGSRAAAFHLGCMRALQDRGLLDQTSTISTVSGGSIIGALWAYSDLSFGDFDQRVQGILRKGLKRGILRYTLCSRVTPKIFLSLITSGLLAAVCSIASFLIFSLRLIGVRGRKIQELRTSLRAPLPRFASRTSAFAAFLNKELFDGAILKAVRRENLHIVINATELRTESAFRFGSLESGCWRYGKLVDDLPVAKAVAASAAFPVLLPALDERMMFEKGGQTSVHRTIITDGGVYDNIGTSCLLPKRDRDFSTNVTDVDFVIACVAGQGLPDGSSLPYFWPSRMISTISTIHRRTHTMTYDLLHRLKENGDIRGFVLPYLGQIDSALPCPPPELVPREATFEYPTDFDPMSQADLDLIAKRGEQLTRNLIETHYPYL